MSYYFSMSFTPVSDKATAYDLCQKAVNLLTEKGPAQCHIKNMYSFLLRRCLFEQTPLTDFIRDMWIQDIFQIRFIYWPQHKLLALCGDDYPDAITSLFGPSIGFQSSTDQDYDLEVWNPDIKIFQSTIRQISSANLDTLKSILEYDDEDDWVVDEDYMRRSAVYRSIFKALDLENWLYGQDGRFERIRMSGLTSQEKTLQVQRWAKFIASKYKENEI